MLEKDIENLIAKYPEEFFPGEALILKGQQVRLGSCFADLIFHDRHNRMIVLEIKRGILSRDAAGQIIEYYGLIKKDAPGSVVELVLCANIIPPERRLFLEQVGIECKELGVELITTVAHKYGYVFLDSKRSAVIATPQPNVFKADSLPLGGVAVKSWIFQANPLRYDVLNALSSGETVGSVKCWLANQHAKEIRSGDIVFIWMSGKEAGIYAVAEVISDPAIISAPPEEDRHWIDLADREKAKLRVKIKIHNVLLNNPLFKSTIKKHGDLKKLSILNYFQGTNFPVSADESRILIDLIKKHC